MFDSDIAIRVAAFERVKRLESIFGDDIPWSAISDGFVLDGEKILLANKAVGIFKPRQLSVGVLSIKTTKPREGRINIYSDSEAEDGSFLYSLQGDDPNNHFNKSLKENMDHGIPLIYFHAVYPSIYKAIFPCFIESIDIKSMLCRVVVGFSKDCNYKVNVSNDLSSYAFPSGIEKKYAIRETKVRLHQASFRGIVLNAYGNKCAMSSLPIRELLEAAHIIPDHDDGIADVVNGVCLSKIHHRAYDSSLISIDPDYFVHVSDKLMSISDGPLLEHAIKSINRLKISVPSDKSLRPNRDYLAVRHEQFLNWST